jgi:TatD DNase family protein
MFLLEHLKLADKYQLPLMLHVRDAHGDMINFLKKHKTKKLRVIIHCFTENSLIVKQYVDLDCYISIPGVITFKNANELKQAIKLIPLNRILSETDAP